MSIGQILMNLLINLVAGILIFLLGLFWPVIPKSYRKYLLKIFWGKSVLKDQFVIAYGTLLDSRVVGQNPTSFRFIKRYHDGRTVQIVGPWGNIVGDCEIRSSSYLINTISTFRKNAVPVIADSQAYEGLDKTFIALGSSSSNEITELVLREPNNKFLRFGQDNNGCYIGDIKSERKFYGFTGSIKKDYGMILKIKNRRSTGNYYFVCAGLGEWGTSGASWYLSKRWKELRKDDEFGIVVEVEVGSDSSAIKVFP